MQGSLDIPDIKIKLNSKRMGELICEQIFDWIMDGTLEIGQKISEEELAEKFGVSRMPVREAIRLLGIKGLVESIPYTGTTIRKLDHSEIKEVYTIRSVLEPLACRYAAYEITLKELEELQKMQNELDECTGEQTTHYNPKDLYLLNRNFHMFMYTTSRMPRLLQIIDNLWDSIAYLRMRTAYMPTYPIQMRQEHQNYINLLRQRDGETLAKLVEKNLINHRNSILD